MSDFYCTAPDSAEPKCAGVLRLEADLERARRVIESLESFLSMTNRYHLSVRREEAQEHHRIVAEQAAQLRHLRAELDQQRARTDGLVKTLTGIHAMLPPEPETRPDGLVFQYRYQDPHRILYSLAERIRAIPEATTCP